MYVFSVSISSYTVPISCVNIIIDFLLINLKVIIYAVRYLIIKQIPDDKVNLMMSSFKEINKDSDRCALPAKMDTKKLQKTK